MKVTKVDIQKCRSLDAVQHMFAAEFPDYTAIDGGLRFTVDQNQFLDILEILASDESKKHYKKFLQNTTCLLLCKDDYSQMVFVVKEMGMAGNVYRKRVVDIRQPRNSDVALLRKIRCGSTSSFLELFNTKYVVSDFYKKYSVLLDKLQENIVGITTSDDVRHYSQLLLSRIMFLYFIQARGFLSGNRDYLRDRFRDITQNGGNFYKDLSVLFFNVLNMEKHERRNDFGNIPFLNGGLFKKHPIEEENHIRINNDIFKEILNFLDGWLWHVDDTIDEASTTTSVNPEILGHIFETMIVDQHGKGAFYTPIDVTEFICNGTIIPYCVRRVNNRFSSEHKVISDVLKNEEHSEYLYFEILKNIRILDPSCGSGEFILTASKVLFDLYMNTWQVVKNQKTSLIVQEQKLMTGRPDYYFKRRIITENLYGVDIENGALEICKLRMWLSLVSAMPVDAVEPLPNIDYNIMQGNSLVGYINIPDKQQQSIDNPYCIEDILHKIDRLKKEYNAETNPRRAMQIRQKIEREVEPCNKLLNRARASDLASNAACRPSAKHMNEINPFHWRLHFHEAILAGGFDIIVGNPPYGAKTDYPTTFLQTHEIGNTFAYFMEVSMNLLKAKGEFGCIIPVSGISSQKMIPLQRILLNGCSELKTSTYDFRPGKIFDGGKNIRLAIVLGVKMACNDDDCSISSTRYHRWYAADRKDLFKKTKYVSFNSLSTSIREKFTNIGTIPKIGEDIEKQIFEKIFKKPALEQEIITKSNFVVWYHNTPLYWIRAMNVPKFTDNVLTSSHVKHIYLKRQDAATIVLALLNSSLFYWFFIKMSDCRDVSKRTIFNMPIGVDDFTPVELTELNGILVKLMHDYKQNYQIDTRKNKKNEKFFVKRSKPIIDMIDDVLARHYGFTQDEVTYVKQFDARFRMSE